MDQYVGGLIGSGFALGWAIAGSLALCGVWRKAAIALSLLLSIGLGYALVQAHITNKIIVPRVDTNWFGYTVAVVTEVLAIVIAARLLSQRGRADLIMPVVGIIVGLHFLGLWVSLQDASFLYVTGAMVAVCGFAIVLQGALRPMVAGFGCAGVLWLSALATLTR